MKTSLRSKRYVIIRVPRRVSSRLPDTSLFKHFTRLKDPRVERTKEHQLLDIVAIAVLAVISGADGWTAIETYGRSKQAWLKQFLELPNGIPSHDTFARVFARLEPVVFRQCFESWIASLVEGFNAQVIAMDGKRLRGSYDREGKQSTLHVVSAWATEHRLVLGQVKVANKSNEITAIPALLDLLDIAGCIITLDAIGCQTEIAAQIISKRADYVLSLKGNHGKLHEAVAHWFNQARANDFIGVECDTYQITESSHHRIEQRQYWVVPVSVLGELPGVNQWAGLQAVGIVVSERRLWNKTTREVRFYLTSLAANAQRLAQAIRTHWGIENQLHWVLDVTFHEDASRIRSYHAPENLAIVRRMALNLLNQEQSFKGSLKMKRYRAAMDNEYLVKILTATIPQKTSPTSDPEDSCDVKQN